jgi:DNA processing protein
MDQDKLSLLALHFIPGIGDHLIRQLISYTGSAQQVFKTPKGKLLRIPGIGEVTAQSIAQGKPFEAAEKEWRQAEAEGIRLLFFIDKEYPSRLKSVHDAPSLIYVKGNIDFERPKMVAIVGTRKATAYGKACVEELVEGLIPHGATIVSGLAYGIDIHAHKQAVKAHLPTIGVMGSGINVIYPSGHKETVKKMLDTGGIITEHPFDTPPDAHHFPARNRIVAALSDAVIIVEAAEKGGALITADIANSYNKDVFAFPGNIGQETSQGCNNLIKDHKAYLITSVRDLEYLMNWNVNEEVLAKPSKTLDLSGCDSQEEQVIKTLMEHNHALMIDELSWRSGFAMSKLASILLSLEFKGMITPLPGKVYKLNLG